MKEIFFLKNIHSQNLPLSYFIFIFQAAKDYPNVLWTRTHAILVKDIFGQTWNSSQPQVMRKTESEMWEARE